MFQKGSQDSSLGSLVPVSNLNHQARLPPIKVIPRGQNFHVLCATVSTSVIL